MSCSGCSALLVVTLAVFQCGVLTQPLEYYDALNNADVEKLREWYDMIQGVEAQMIDENTALLLLENESCLHRHSSRCRAFNEALNAGKEVNELWRAQSVAVTMYTSELIYREYNADLRNGSWGHYKVFSYLLYAAVKELSRHDRYKVKDTDTLYRCFRDRLERPQTSRLYWKTFTSTSLVKEAARRFGEGTTLTFTSLATKFGAIIDELSLFPTENEVLLLPFESFDVLDVYLSEDNTMFFKSSENQDILE